MGAGMQTSHYLSIGYKTEQKIDVFQWHIREKQMQGERNPNLKDLIFKVKRIDAEIKVSILKLKKFHKKH